MNKNDKKKRGGGPEMNRRQFLGQASCAAVGTTALFSTVLDLGMFNALAGTGAGAPYRGLVCLFLGGGADTFNMLVPRGQSEYDEYAAVRADLALPQIDLLPITPNTADGRQYGLHPGMPELQNLFELGQAALVANVGTLVEPITLAQYQNGSGQRPLGLFSHSDQQMQWQTSVPDSRNAVGWAGRMADLLQSLNTNQNISMNISLNGSNILQSGNVTSHYTINQNGSTGLLDYNGVSPLAAIRTEAIDGLLGQSYQNLFEQTFAARMRGAIDAHVEFSAAIESLAPFQTVFSDNGLSQRFRMVAQTIAARQILGMERQTFFIEAGGWDHHDEVIANQATMLPIISAALAEFQAAMIELGVDNDVTTFTASDFGRTLSSNGRGSDHAWGGNHIVMGGAVQGREIFGQFPDLYPGGPLDTGRGRLIPSTSIDQYHAELALWFGVPRADLPLVLPNIDRFWNSASSGGPLGLMDLSGTGSSAPTTLLRQVVGGEERRVKDLARRRP